MIAYCWASGRIEFGRKLPDGALPVAKGPARALRADLQTTARHGYERGLLLVPGVPEAPTEDAAVDALVAFRQWANGKRARKDGVAYVGVV